MKSEDKSRFAEACDGTLFPLGFKRRAISQEWSRVSGADRVWIHLNFAKHTLINPSFGVEYLDLRNDFPDLPGATWGTMMMFGDLFEPSRQYTLDHAPTELATDLVERGLPAAAQLQDRRRVATLLRSPKPRDWPVPSFSHRIRLAPVLLASLGQIDDALTLVDEFASEASGKDQILPAYDVFVESFRSMIEA